MSLIFIAQHSLKRVNLSNVAKNGVYQEKATPGEEYRVIDSVTGKTPADIKVSRIGHKLIIKSEKENIEVIIDEFWGECTPAQQCYAIFDTASSEGVHQSDIIVTQVGREITAFSAGSAEPNLVTSLAEGQVISPWYYAAGAAVLGGVALAAGAVAAQVAVHPAQLMMLKNRLNNWQMIRSKQLRMLKQRQKAFSIK
ncbi:hypothetical protein [Gallibacterium anatis]|uniref:hypothetical protein n=1 Tax=Gallibacterium anatis TaxID=750 RepID=UPI0006917655|nr:hypothetical protein [Gallibacterium anatis]